MANKLLVFLGLADSEGNSPESHRKQRGDYMRKIQRLVIDDDKPDEFIENERPEPPEIDEFNTVIEEPLPVKDEIPSPETNAAAVSSVPDEKDANKEDNSNAPRHSSNILGRRLFKSYSSVKTKEPQLIFIRKNILDMTDDIEEALTNGQCVLLDFEKEDEKEAKQAVTRILNFVRVHNGAFYTVNRTSLLLTMDKTSIVEWLSEKNEEK